jgi:hypothetical protein
MIFQNEDMMAQNRVQRWALLKMVTKPLGYIKRKEFFLVW